MRPNIILIITLFAPFTLSLPSLAADKVVFKYGFLRTSITTQELQTFANQGKTDAGLATYIRKAGGNPQGVQTALTQQVRIDHRLLDRALNSSVGNLLLDQVSTTIQTPTQTANRQALRSALVLSASPDNKVSLLEIIENYPTSEVQVDGNQLANTYRQVSNFAQEVQKLRDLVPFF